MPSFTKASLALLLGVLACGAPHDVIIVPDAGTENCTNRFDDDGDGKVDCLDPQCFSAPACLAKVERCDNHLDDNGDGIIDCAQASCEGQACGIGCVCLGGQETHPRDGGSTGGGAATGGGTATGGGSATGGATGGGVATGGGFATGGGRATGGGAATGGGTGGGVALKLDGVACAVDTECAGGKCFTEASTGSPQGACGNTTACASDSNCRGGRCIAGRCYAKCSGLGLVGSDACRAGYACSDAIGDGSSNYCQPLCTSNAECAGANCNDINRLCLASTGVGNFGDSCSSNDDCATGLCNQDSMQCIGVCRFDQPVTCPLGADRCRDLWPSGDPGHDNVGVCN